MTASFAGTVRSLAAGALIFSAGTVLAQTAAAPALPTPVSAWIPPEPASACEACAGTPDDAIAPGSSCVIEVANTVPVIARPTDPPTCWKNVRLLVAAPIWRTGTLFWTTSAKTEKTGPIPSPVTTGLSLYRRCTLGFRLPWYRDWLPIYRFR